MSELFLLLTRFGFAFLEGGDFFDGGLLVGRWDVVVFVEILKKVFLDDDDDVLLFSTEFQAGY